MIRSIKVVSSMLVSYITTIGARKKYGCGNSNYSKKESRQHIYTLAQKLARNMIKAAGVTVEVQGAENLPEEGPVLYIANHKSIFDIVVLVTLIKEPCIFIGKKEVADMPLVGDWFDALGCIYIDRKDIRQSLQAIMEGISELKSGQSVVVFPEGTRTHSQDMKNFKEGSFKLASKTKVPIIPIALQDTYKIYEEKKSIQSTKVYVNIGRSINQDTLNEEEKKNLPGYVQNVVHELLKQITFNND